MCWHFHASEMEARGLHSAACDIEDKTLQLTHLPAGWEWRVAAIPHREGGIKQDGTTEKKREGDEINRIRLK